MTILNDQILTAYADGELDRDTAAQVKAALAGNSKAAETVRRFQEVTRLARQAYDGPLHGAVPERLLRAVEATPVGASLAVDLAARRARRPNFSVRRMALPIAASLVLLIGGFVGYQLKPGADQVAEVVAALTSDIVRPGGLHDVLEAAASGRPVRWKEEASGLQVEAVVRLTFEASHGGYCREYLVTAEGAGQRQSVSGVACRSPEGDWRTEILVASEPSEMSTGTGTYAPASGRGVETLDSYLAKVMAAPALDREAESGLLQSGWR